MQAMMMPSVGWLEGCLGNQRRSLLACGVFVAGSVLYDMAWDVYTLIALRALQARVRQTTDPNS